MLSGFAARTWRVSARIRVHSTQKIMYSAIHLLRFPCFCYYCIAIYQNRKRRDDIAYMVEIMEHRGDNRIEKLLRGTALGAALALRACPDGVAAGVAARFGEEAAGRVRIAEPCRMEHPHSAFLRKPVEIGGEKGVQTTLWAPGGKLTETRLPDGAAADWFVRKPEEYETLRGFLRDVELYPARNAPAPEGCAQLASLGLTPVRELEVRWAGPETTARALMEQNESAASCLRKLERHLHRRTEEAHRAGCRVALLRDMAAEPLPETYMLHAGRHVEWIRHAGLSPFVEVSLPEPMLLAALFAAGAGARAALLNPALYEPAFAPPEGMRFLLDAYAAAGFAGLEPERMSDMLARCGGAVVMLDCGGAGEDEVCRAVEALMEIVRR